MFAARLLLSLFFFRRGLCAQDRLANYTLLHSQTCSFADGVLAQLWHYDAAQPTLRAVCVCVSFDRLVSSRCDIRFVMFYVCVCIVASNGSACTSSMIHSISWQVPGQLICLHANMQTHKYSVCALMRKQMDTFTL